MGHQLMIWSRGVLVMLTFILTASCGANATLPESEPAARVEAGEQEGISRVILTSRAAERLGIETTTVAEQGEHLIVPYSTLIYDTHGETWLFTVIGPETYMRAPLTIDYIDGDRIFLLDGPDIGTEVVTVGVAELYGTETGVGQ